MTCVPEETKTKVSGKELIVFEHADLGYGRRKVISDLNLTLHAGDYLGIVGPNGCGKTTMLKAMLGILNPLRGRVHRDPGMRFGYVPQRQFIDEAYPLTAGEVATMGRYPLMGVFSRPSKADKEFVVECLEHVGIADLADRSYRELSGGQKQRTLIARALAAQPGVLILDEPTNDMDIGSEHAIMELLTKLREEDGITIAIVSHLLNVLVNFVEDFALIDGGLRLMGRAVDVLTPKNLTEVYGVPVEVAKVRGKKVVLVGGTYA
jgi:ABC-type Mn2+/Zn2+ transport system ATPase subunit